MFAVYNDLTSKQPRFISYGTPRAKHFQVLGQTARVARFFPPIGGVPCFPAHPGCTKSVSSDAVRAECWSCCTATPTKK